MSADQPQKPNVGVIVVVAVAAVVGSSVATFIMKSSLPTSESSVNAVLAKIASEMNRNLPAMIDQVTRLDTTVALPGKKLMYKYTILNVNSTPNRDALINAMRPMTINNYKTSKEMADLRKMNVTLVYYYADKKGQELAQFEISPQDFK